MKKILLVLPALLLISACAKEPGSSLPPLDSSSNGEGSSESGPSEFVLPEGHYMSTLTSENAGFTDNEDLTEALTPSIASTTDESVKYSFEVGAPAYHHSKFNEIVLKESAYIKSVSTYKVKRIFLDVFGKQASMIGLFATSDGSGEQLEAHVSSQTPIDAAGGGKVFEYEVNSNSWYIKNLTDKNKPAVYAVTVVYTIE